MKKIIIPLISVLLLCGCSGYKEINSGYLVTAVAITQNTDGTQITLNTLLPQTQEKLILSAQGDSLYTAVKNLKQQQTKAFYFDHCGVVVLNQQAKVQIKQILNFCKTQIKIPIAATVVYCNDVTALFAADRTGYDVISLIKNTDTEIDARIYKLLQKSEYKLPFITVRDNIMLFEGEIQ